MVAAKLFVSIQVNRQQSVDFIGLKGFAAFELAVDPTPGPAQLFRIHPLAGITKGVMTDRMLVTHPLLPLGQFGFLL